MSLCRANFWWVVHFGLDDAQFNLVLFFTEFKEAFSLFDKGRSYETNQEYTITDLCAST